MKRILIINGPNLNLLGRREPGIYGDTAFESFLAALRAEHGEVEIDYYQSNHEGDIVTRLQDTAYADDAALRADGVVLNAGAYTHTSVAIADAIRAIATPVVEVHISNVHQREEFRHHSYLSPVAAGIIVGFGLDGYRLAVDGLLKMINK